jgi:hypothetical protein
MQQLAVAHAPASCPSLQDPYDCRRSRSPDAFIAAAQLADAAEPLFQTPAFTAALRAGMADAGLEVYEQPFAVAPRVGGGGELRCANIYAVLRSPRGDGKECVVLVTPVTLQPFATGELGSVWCGGRG